MTDLTYMNKWTTCLVKLVISLTVSYFLPTPIGESFGGGGRAIDLPSWPYESVYFSVGGLLKSGFGLTAGIFFLVIYSAAIYALITFFLYLSKKVRSKSETD